MPLECLGEGNVKKVVKKGLIFLFIACLAIVFFLPLNGVYAAETESKSYLIINKAVNELAYFNGGELIKVFDVGTGKSRKLTPEGTFKIVNKVKNRPYYKEKIPGGSPKNPLGDRWMGLDVPGTWGNTYGIHGNNNEKSIGKYVSAGCIRMHNDDVRWLFDQIATGTTVFITHEKKDFLTIAADNGFAVKLPKVEKVDKKITTLVEKNLYQKPINFAGYKSGTISPQVVTAFEETDNGWYRIHTWFGDAWISNANTIEGKLEKKDSEIVLTKTTNLYASPNATAASIGTVSPQTVKAFEQIGDWYHIKTWFGDAWIYVKK
ncbi:MAG TPA: L,D-transpeptidase [Bacillus bacterium]|nr:L,D-transpeptidase [Bacillus sp. (in: firmicutes)]